jgi:ferredoxin
MVHVITSPCEGTCDTACVDVCPVECIHGPLSLERIRALPANERPARLAGVQLFIDPDECIGCAACVPECPVEAIFDEDEVPDEHRGDIERNAAFFRSS